MATMAENIIAAGSETCPPMLEKGMTMAERPVFYSTLEQKRMWSRFVTAAKQARDLHAVTFDQLQSQGYTGSSGKNQALGARVVNTIGNAGANQTRVIRCYNCNSEGHIAKQCTTKKKVKDSEWFKDKMLLAQAQEAGVADHVDAYDLDCDDEATTNAIFMANLSPVGSINGDTVEPHYDSNILSEVPHYDTYHDTDVLNPSVQ
ncbi:retrovirus-related pol polyprotein from transposon TNT 1-94 [Tanacetum coccineum]